MPVSVRKTPSGRYSVRTHPPGEESHLKAKHTTKKKAMAQRKLLNAVEHGWRPTGKPAKRRHESQELVTHIVDLLLEREF
jgi:hypothetical protein